jgi:hypothetical protein
MHGRKQETKHINFTQFLPWKPQSGENQQEGILLGFRGNDYSSKYKEFLIAQSLTSSAQYGPAN